MRSEHRTGFLLVLAVVFAIPAIAGGPIEIPVDCDKGESLQRALDKLDRHGGGRILLSGTCRASARVFSEAFIEIVGESAQSTSIESGPAPAVYAFGAGWLEVRNVRLAGGNGAWAAGPNRAVVVSECEVEADWSGIVADSGAVVLVENSTVSGQSNAVYVSDASAIVDGGRLHDSTFAARLFGGKLVLDEVEVTDNGIGVFAHDRSEVSVQSCALARNGQGHLGAVTDSRLVLYNSEVGGHGDPTNLSIYVDRGSAAEVYNDDPQAEIWGPATIHDDSFISIEGAMLHGSIALRGFSRLLLDGRVLDGIVDCQSAADAWCGPTASAFTSGCGSIPGGSCVPDPASKADEPQRPSLLDLPQPQRGERP